MRPGQCSCLSVELQVMQQEDGAVKQQLQQQQDKLN